MYVVWPMAFGPKCELMAQLISPSKCFLKFQYVAHYRSKFYKIMPKNHPSHKRLFNSTKSVLQFTPKKLVWIFLNFFLTKLLARILHHRFKPYETTLGTPWVTKGFPKIPHAQYGTNKLSFLIYRYIFIKSLYNDNCATLILSIFKNKMNIHHEFNMLWINK